MMDPKNAPPAPVFLYLRGTRDDVVDVELSREWSRDRPHVRLIEVDDGHELGASIPRLLTEADDFFRPFLGP